MIKGGLIYPQLQRLGKISIGEKGEVRTSAKGKTFQNPKKLSFFTIRTHYRTEKGQLALDTELMKRLGSEPVELKIRLPFNDLEKNFEYELRYYKGGMKYCSGDGEQGYRRESRVVNGKTVYGDVKPFGPCGRACPDFQNRDCKRWGALRVILEEQQQVGGVYEYRTTSRHSIENILSGLMTIRLQTGGVLAWLPLTMRLVPQTVTTPEGQAVRAYIVQIVFSGSPQALLETVRDILALRAPVLSEIKALEAGIPQTIDDPMESKDIQDEFYPEQSVKMLHAGESSAGQEAPERSPASTAEISRAIIATLQLHRPYAGPREGAYTTFIPPDAMQVVREIFDVEKYADLKKLSVDQLQQSYETLLEFFEPGQDVDDLEVVDAEFLDAHEPQDERSGDGEGGDSLGSDATNLEPIRRAAWLDEPAPLSDDAEAHLASIRAEAETARAVAEIKPPIWEPGSNGLLPMAGVTQLRTWATDLGLLAELEVVLQECPGYKAAPQVTEAVLTRAIATVASAYEARIATPEDDGEDVP